MSKPEVPLSPADVAGRIRRSRRCVALTGAGISTGAGIPDFRGPGGLYESGRYDPHRVFDIRAFREDPSEFYRFTRDMVDSLDQMKPTYTHRFLAAAERAGLLRFVITQNIDPLHRQAGSENLIALHGDYSTSTCQLCGKSYTFEEMLERLESAPIPVCDCDPAAALKPNVVFFGEPVGALPEAMAQVRSADLLLVLGSSLTVSPASILPETCPGDVIVVNKSAVGLPRRPGRYFLYVELDAFFEKVAGHLPEVAALLR
jgi:NAD-dependent deacetylase